MADALGLALFSISRSNRLAYRASQPASLIGMGLIAALRLAAIRWELKLPVFEVNE